MPTPTDERRDLQPTTGERGWVNDDLPDEGGLTITRLQRIA